MCDVPEHQFKVILVGDASVGKSSLLLRYACETYSSPYMPTTGTDFKTKIEEVEETGCRMEVWDTAGRAALQPTFSPFFRNAQGVLLCYNVCDRQSFQSLNAYLQQVQMNAPVDCVVMVVACKGDSFYSRKISTVEGEKYASSKRCGFMEVSAKKNRSVDTLFHQVCGTILKACQDPSRPSLYSNTVFSFAEEADSVLKNPLELVAPSSTDTVQDGQPRSPRSPDRISCPSSASPLPPDASLECFWSSYDEVEEPEELVLRRSTTTDTVSCNRILHSAYPVYISGAMSWYNRLKINGRYVPQMAPLSRRTPHVQLFCYSNLDSKGTSMVYMNGTWVIRRNRKVLARLASPSIDCFPDIANQTAAWMENTGVYFTWMHEHVTIKCVALSDSPMAGAILSAEDSQTRPSLESRESYSLSRGNSFCHSPRGSFSDRTRGSLSEHGPGRQSFSYSSSGAGSKVASQALTRTVSAQNMGKPACAANTGSGIFSSLLLLQRQPLGASVVLINMEVFQRCRKDPQHTLGLTALLFARYCALRLALLELECKGAPQLLDSATLVQISAQAQRMQECCTQLLQEQTTQAVVAPSSPRNACAVPLPPQQHGYVRVEPTEEAVQTAGSALLLQLNRQLASLCVVGVGDFTQAGRCRDIKVEVEHYLVEVKQGGVGSAGERRKSGSFSLRRGHSFSFSK